MNEGRIFGCFEDGKATRKVDGRLQLLTPITMSGDYEAKMLHYTKEVVELNERKAFLEGVADYLGDFDPTDTEGMLQRIRQLYSEKGIELSRTVVEWFRKGTPPSKNHRRNLYDFCVALGMDYHTTAEFFLKVFLTIPYNYKDPVDAIYLYCLKAARPYSVVKEMLKSAEAFEATNPDAQGTERIGVQILHVNSDAEFLEYLRLNCYDSKHQYMTAKTELLRLLTKNKEIRTIKPDEISKTRSKINPIKLKGTDSTSSKRNPNSLGNAELLNQILGYSYQGLNPEQKAHLDNCNLPRFTTDVDISNILSPNKNASAETIRKALILMEFYHFFRSKQISAYYDTEYDPEDVDNIQACYNDFLEETNLMLSKCGFVQLYVRNPYDWIILFCAYSQDPIIYLQDFIEKRYFGEVNN